MFSWWSLCSPILTCTDKQTYVFWHCLSLLTRRLKDSIFLKNRHFFLSKKGLIKLIYSIDTIIKCDIWQPVKFQLVSRFWTGSKMKWFLSYLWINVGNINSELRYKIISFQEWETNCSFTVCHFYDCINTIYQFMIALIPYIILKPFLDNKMSIFEVYMELLRGMDTFSGVATLSKLFCLLSSKGNNRLPSAANSLQENKTETVEEHIHNVSVSP